ncbi:JmjC domain-containing protein 7 [Gaertneriomyces sp. JEL0708]|nr:JmjC domain-containing protein 7 [Gaertneriomyces sp. JEL0708]
MESRLEQELGRLAREARQLGCSNVEYFDQPPTPLEFMRLVHANRPAIIENVATAWPAMKRWRSRQYLEQILGDTEITVAVTPNGLADAVTHGHFVLPYELKMRLSELLDKFKQAGDDSTMSSWKPGEASEPVYYVQSQNNNMHEDFKTLLRDVPQDISFASEALGQKPDAVNFWLGSGRATTSLHKDHYENLYVVVAGTKTFTLIPPTESFCLQEQPYPTAQYTPNVPNITSETTWGLRSLQPALLTPWCPIDPIKPSNTFPLFIRHCRPVTVTVKAGQCLYLPSMWHHYVQQSEEPLDGFKAAIAVNYWYDMEYQKAFVTAGFVARCGRMVAGIEEWDHEITDADAGEDET